MIEDCKGIGSFMESIAAVMVVTVALTSFMGLLAYSELAEEKENVEIDMHFLNALSVTDNGITGDVSAHLAEICEKNGYSEIVLNIDPVGFEANPRVFRFGSSSAIDYRYFSGNLPVENDRGETVLISYEMEVFL